MFSAVDAWYQHVSSRVDSAKMSALHVETPDGQISVTPCGHGEYLARLRWTGGYGTRDLARASFDRILALVHEQVTYGITYPPLYHERDDDLDLLRDGSIFRKVLPEGELRIVTHHSGFIGLLVEPNSVRILAWSDEFEIAHEASRRQVHLEQSTRMMVRIRGRLRALRVCSADGILAYYSTDDLSVFIVPGAPFMNSDGVWDAPVAVTVVRADRGAADVRTYPSLCSLDGNEVIWSDEWPLDQAPRSADPRRPPQHESSAPSQFRASPGASAPDSDVVALFCRYLDTLDHNTGSGQSMRQQVAPLLRACAQSGAADIRACGRHLRATLVERSGLPLCGSDRSFRHAIAFFHHICPLLVRREGKRDTILAFSELRHGTPLAAWLHDKLAPHPARPRPNEQAPEPTPPVVDNAKPPPVDINEPKASDAGPHRSPVPTSDAPPVVARRTVPPWFDEHSSPEVAASIARYLGPPASNAHLADTHAEPSVSPVPTGPPTTKSDPDTEQ